MTDRELYSISVAAGHSQQFTECCTEIGFQFPRRISFQFQEEPETDQLEKKELVSFIELSCLLFEMSETPQDLFVTIGFVALNLREVGMINRIHYTLTKELLKWVTDGVYELDAEERLTRSALDFITRVLMISCHRNYDIFFSEDSMSTMSKIIARLFDSKEIPSSLRLEEIKDTNQKLEDSLLILVLQNYSCITSIDYKNLTSTPKRTRKSFDVFSEHIMSEIVLSTLTELSKPIYSKTEYTMILIILVRWTKLCMYNLTQYVLYNVADSDREFDRRMISLITRVITFCIRTLTAHFKYSNDDSDKLGIMDMFEDLFSTINIYFTRAAIADRDPFCAIWEISDQPFLHDTIIFDVDIIFTIFEALTFYAMIGKDNYLEFGERRKIEQSGKACSTDFTGTDLDHFIEVICEFVREDRLVTFRREGLIDCFVETCKHCYRFTSEKTISKLLSIIYATFRDNSERCAIQFLEALYSSLKIRESRKFSNPIIVKGQTFITLCLRDISTSSVFTKEKLKESESFPQSLILLKDILKYGGKFSFMCDVIDYLCELNDRYGLKEFLRHEAMKDVVRVTTKRVVSLVNLYHKEQVKHSFKGTLKMITELVNNYKDDDESFESEIAHLDSYLIRILTLDEVKEPRFKDFPTIFEISWTRTRNGSRFLEEISSDTEIEHILPPDVVKAKIFKYLANILINSVLETEPPCSVDIIKPLTSSLIKLGKSCSCLEEEFVFEDIVPPALGILDYCNDTEVEENVYTFISIVRGLNVKYRVIL